MNNIRIGHGYDVHALQDGLPFFLGGISITHTKGCIAHSDGDVAIHAICDALLGALALGDIGKHFPDTSDKYKGIDSKILLLKCVKLITSHGYSISNVDITIALQAPKIGLYIEQMRTVLAQTMNIPLDSISVKATTTEKLGFVGRKEGIEAHCVVLLYK